MNNQQEIFSKIYDNCINKIYRFVFLKVSSQQIAEDICSETFLRGWEIFKNSENGIDNPQAFLYQIARNLVVDHYREKGKAQVISADNTPVLDPKDTTEAVFASLDLEKVKTAIAGLKDEYQDVVVWRYIEDLAMPDIAKIMNKSEGAVRVTLHRALSALKKQMGEA